MKFRKLFILLMVFCFTAVQAQPGMGDQVIPNDTAVRIGKLANGLTYYIRHNNWPEHRANFYIAQKVGSIQEEESQRGLAHFLEHMCFNGTKHFPGNGIIRWCESIGVKFGNDLNAYTSIDQTVYNISNVPTNRQSALDSCLLILSDWADGLILDPQEIDKERGVIHEEWRLRTSASSRMFERNLPKLYPDSKYGVRYPIGLMSVVDNFKPKELRDYYEKWYHPTNQGIIVVGDVNVDAVEATIKKLFSDIKNPENAAPIVDEKVPDNAAPIVIIDKDKEYRMTMVDFMLKHKAFPDSLKNTVSYELLNYMMNAATTMLNSRYEEAAQNADCPYTTASASYSNYIFAKTKDAFDISFIPKDMKLSDKAMEQALIEARKAAEFGFTATEYGRFKADQLSSLENRWNERDKRTNDQLANECVNNFLSNEAIISMDMRYPFMKQVIPAIPLEGINELMKKMLPQNDSNMVIINFNTEKDGNVYPTSDGLLAAVNQASKAQITAYVDNVKNEPLITKMPKAGKIVSEKKNDKLGFTEMKLSNGVTVVLKKTDFKKDEVSLNGEGWGGNALYGPKDYSNCDMFDEVIGGSGLGNFSNTELTKALAGKIANADLAMGERTMNISGSSTPKDFETMLQMAYLYFTNIKKDEKNFATLMEQNKVNLKNRSLSEMSAFSDTLQSVTYDHNPRTAPMTVERLGQVNYDRILQMAKERTASANGWTFTIIGNYDENTIRPLICQYLGALPKGKVTPKPKRQVMTSDKNVENKFLRKMETPKAYAYIRWHNTAMPYTVKNDLRASIAGQILQMIYLKKIREEASAAYTVSAACFATKSDDIHSTDMFGVCPMKPEKCDTAIEIMNKEVSAMAKTVDASMLTKVKEYLLKTYDNQVKSNGYWFNVLDNYRKYNIDRYTGYKELVNKQTPNDISAFVGEVLKNANKLSVVMLPEEKK